MNTRIVKRVALCVVVIACILVPNYKNISTYIEHNEMRPLAEAAPSEPIPIEEERHCNTSLSDTQVVNLTLAHNLGSEIGYPETVQAIMLIESEAGESATVGNKTAPVGKRVYGLMQLKTVAVRYVFHNYPEVKEKYFQKRALHKIEDEELIALIITNDEANVEIGALNFELMLEHTTTWDDAVTAYYTGIEGLKRGNPSGGYLDKVKKAIHKVRPLNECMA